LLSVFHVHPSVSPYLLCIREPNLTQSFMTY